MVVFLRRENKRRPLQDFWWSLGALSVTERFWLWGGRGGKRKESEGRFGSAQSAQKGRMTGQEEL